MLSVRAASARLPPLRSKARRISISSSLANAVGRSSSGQSRLSHVVCASPIKPRSATLMTAPRIRTESALHRILELANISGPVVPEQAGRRIGGELFAAAAAEEMLGQRNNVGDALAERRQ